MSRLSAAAVEESIRLLAGTEMTAAAASALEAYLVSKRLNARHLAVTIANVNLVVGELFSFYPSDPHGRIQPFSPKTVNGAHGVPKWGVVSESGRKTVWNVTTRRQNTLAASLFDGGDIRNGLRENAAHVLGEALKRGQDETKPGELPLLIFCLRQESFSDPLDHEQLLNVFEAEFSIAPNELGAFCDAVKVASLLVDGTPWSPESLPEYLRPPKDEVAASRGGRAVSAVPTPMVVDERVQRMVRLSILSTSAVMLVGPPGTGKTRLLRETLDEIASNPIGFGFEVDKPEALFVTPDESWTTRDLVGGETVDEKSQLRFRTGFVLDAIKQDRWLVLDEANRADMDKIFGGLLTWLSDEEVELGRVSTHADSPPVLLGWSPEPTSKTEHLEALDDETPSGGPVRFLAGTEWRLLGTYNALDAQRVFRFGQALTRRFARVPVPAASLADFRTALKPIVEGLPLELADSLGGLYQAHLAGSSTALGPALFLRIPAYVKAGLAELAENVEEGVTHGEAATSADAEGSVKEATVAWQTLLSEAYLVNVGTWLSRLEANELAELGLRIVDTHKALPAEQWTWLETLLPNLG